MLVAEDGRDGLAVAVSGAEAAIARPPLTGVVSVAVCHVGPSSLVVVWWDRAASGAAAIRTLCTPSIVLADPGSILDI